MARALWYRLPASEVLQQLGSSAENGLTADEATRRLRAHGANELERAHHVSAWEVFAAQFKTS
jgi:Ca2+-transporting ATPase